MSEPGTTAPLASVTVPMMPVSTDCAQAEEALSIAESTRMIRYTDRALTACLLEPNWVSTPKNQLPTSKSGSIQRGESRPRIPDTPAFTQLFQTSFFGSWRLG